MPGRFGTTFPTRIVYLMAPALFPPGKVSRNGKADKAGGNYEENLARLHTSIKQHKGAKKT